MAQGNALPPSVEAAVGKRAALRNVDQRQESVKGKLNGTFRSSDAVTRVSLA